MQYTEKRKNREGGRRAAVEAHWGESRLVSVGTHKGGGITSVLGPEAGGKAKENCLSWNGERVQGGTVPAGGGRQGARGTERLRKEKTKGARERGKRGHKREGNRMTGV